MVKPEFKPSSFKWKPWLAGCVGREGSVSFEQHTEQPHKEVQSFQESIQGALEQSSRKLRNRQCVAWEHLNSRGKLCFISKVGLHFQLLAPFRGFLYTLRAQQNTCHWTLLPVRSSSKVPAGQFSVSYLTEIKYVCSIAAWFCFISTCQREHHNESSHLLWINSPTLAIRIVFSSGSSPFP